jgi:hypothetical protein
MRFITTTLFLPLLAATVSAGKVKVNYYKDGGCTDWLASFNPADDGSCYNYALAGMNSANVVDCHELSCACDFYPENNCNGKSRLASTENGNCASNWGTGYRSMKCAYVF